jgi:hypothetical protein
LVARQAVVWMPLDNTLTEMMAHLAAQRLLD